MRDEAWVRELGREEPTRIFLAPLVRSGFRRRSATSSLRLFVSPSPLPYNPPMSEYEDTIFDRIIAGEIPCH
jgi:hypothetical protein